MSAITTTGAAMTPITVSSPTARALVRAEAQRFARHPLFLAGAAAAVIITVIDTVDVGRLDTDPLALTIIPAFFLGVFGFVVAHRLTTSLGRSREVVDATPVDEQLRTVALCIACLVPAAVGAVWMMGVLVIGALWPPVGDPASAPLAWFGDEAAADVLGVLVSGGPVAALGGSLLGVAVARWAPFRGSALLGMVALVCVVAVGIGSTRWGALAPYVTFADEEVVHGKIVTSYLDGEVSPPWYVLYTLCLCGLAVVAALLRGAADRRRLLGVGGVLVVVALGSFALAVS